MVELYKLVGGLPGIVSLIAVVAAVWWRFKVPTIGLEMLQRELEIHRHEIAEADRERQALRREIKTERNKVAEFEEQFMACLVERERALRALRLRDRLLRENGIAPPVPEDD